MVEMCAAFPNSLPQLAVFQKCWPTTRNMPSQYSCCLGKAEKQRARAQRKYMPGTYSPLLHVLFLGAVLILDSPQVPPSGHVTLKASASRLSHSLNTIQQPGWNAFAGGDLNHSHNPASASNGS